MSMQRWQGFINGCYCCLCQCSGSDTNTVFPFLLPDTCQLPVHIRLDFRHHGLELRCVADGIQVGIIFQKGPPDKTPAVLEGGEHP